MRKIAKNKNPTHNKTLILYLKEQEKEEQTNSKISIKKKITKIRVETNETKNQIENISETKHWFWRG